MTTDLSTYNNAWYDPGSWLKRVCWYPVNEIIFKSAWFPFYGLKRSFLRLFGARVGKGVFIKPGVNIKYPWFLIIGDHVWIGEKVWIDNLAKVTIGNHVCLSQGAILLCGNHNFSTPSFELMAEPISLEDGVWIGAGAVVCGGVSCRSHSVLSVSSVATGTLLPYSIYQGNPAQKVKDRMIR
ncbi:MAG: WcaF family extracellular polysaccharide biosynthesis acetyltransferase [Ginsengibacter sp.]